MHRVVLVFALGLFLNPTVYAGKIVPLKKVNKQLNYTDDMNFEHMLKAIERQEKSFKRRNLDQKIKFGPRSLTRRHLYQSVVRFKQHVAKALNCFELYPSDVCYQEFNQKMNAEFEVYKPMPASWERGYKTAQTFFTAYYSPDFEGSFVKTEEFKNPIYAKPKDSKLQRVTSDEINFQGKFKGKGLEIVYVKESLYDIWLLHVEGGGRVRVKQADGTYKILYLSYTGANKRHFQMLSKYMIAQGMLPKGQRSIEHQRQYFNSHPADQRAILKTCPSFIYFEVTEKEPVGVQSMELTENRSLATDYRRMEEYGVINFIQTKKPIFTNGQLQKVNFSRFFLNQDTGGAIKGNARVDLYFGYGKKAELAANYVYGLGDQYFLILK